MFVTPFDLALVFWHFEYASSSHRAFQRAHSRIGCLNRAYSTRIFESVAIESYFAGSGSAVESISCVGGSFLNLFRVLGF